MNCMQLQGSPVDFCHELRHVIIGIINRTLERMYKTSEAYYKILILSYNLHKL